MRLNFKFVLFLFVTACVSTPVQETQKRKVAGIRDLEGVVVKVADQKVTFRTAKETLTLDQNALPASVKDQVVQEVGLNKRTKFSIDESSILESSRVRVGIRPDCTELPIKYDEILSLARNPEVKSSIDFLKILPEGTLQTFTLVHSSNSVQKVGVDAMWPRVLRMSADGKLILSYTCEPNSPSYNSIEMIRFDDSENSYKFTSLDFHPGNGAGAKPRVTENPESCLGCHAPTKYKNSDPRPIWQMYSFWKGVYGAADDRLKPNNEVGEQYSLQEFKKLQKDNPCYASLPWPNYLPNENPHPDYALYPYSDRRKTSNYHLRPNLKFTEIQVHLLAKRLARKFFAVPRFKKLRMLMLMEGLGCNVPDLDAKIKQVFPRYKAPQVVTSIPQDHLDVYEVEYKAQDFNLDRTVLSNHLLKFDPRSALSRGRSLYALGEAFNFVPSDWNLTHPEFTPPLTPMYNSGLSSTRDSNDVSVVHMVQGEIFRKIAEEYPEVRSYLVLTRGESKVFGENFACVDDLGGEINLTNANQINDVCKIVGELHLKESNLPKTPNKSIRETIENAKREKIKSEINPALIETGRALVQNKCSICHSEAGGLPKSYHFFTNEESLREKLRNESYFTNLIFSRLAADVGTMPPTGHLPPEERKAIESYVYSLSQK